MARTSLLRIESMRRIPRHLPDLVRTLTPLRNRAKREHPHCQSDSAGVRRLEGHRNNLGDVTFTKTGPNSHVQCDPANGCQLESSSHRDDRIRTCDPLNPIQVRYRAAPHPVAVTKPANRHKNVIPSAVPYQWFHATFHAVERGAFGLRSPLDHPCPSLPSAV